MHLDFYFHLNPIKAVWLQHFPKMNVCVCVEPSVWAAELSFSALIYYGLKFHTKTGTILTKPNI